MFQWGKMQTIFGFWYGKCWNLVKQSRYLTWFLPFIKPQTNLKKIKKERKAFHQVFRSKWCRQLFYLDVYLLACEKQKNLVLNTYYIFLLFVAHNFVLIRGSGEIKLIDFDGIGTENRFVTPEYQPYEHFEVGVYRNSCCKSFGNWQVWKSWEWERKQKESNQNWFKYNSRNWQRLSERWCQFSINQGKSQGHCYWIT